MSEVPFTVQCPTCAKTLQATLKHVGKQARCPSCGTIVVIASPVTATPPALPNPDVLVPQINVSSARFKTRHRRTSYSMTFGVAVVALTVGYLAGREHLKYEMRSALSKAGEAFQEGLQNAFRGKPVSAPVTDWRKQHNLSEKDGDRLYQQWLHRTGKESGAVDEFWAMALKSTPAEIERLFPALQRKEWYAASVNKQSSSWRNFDSDLFIRSGDERTHRLTLLVNLRVEPNRIVKSVAGELTFSSGKQVLVSVPIVHEPDVSFEDRTYYRFKIDPYDDSNPVHRKLRFDDGIQVRFAVTRVEFADGTTQSF